MTIEEQAQLVVEPQSLAELLAKASADGLENNPKSGLSFLEKFLPGRKRLANRLTGTLPSGLTVEEAADISNAISTTLRRLYRADQTIGERLRPSDVILTWERLAWQAAFAEGIVQPGRAAARQEQPALARLFYGLIQGHRRELNGKADLKELANTFPETVAVLERALDGGYASSGEMAGAFGWSLYHQDQLLHAPPEPRPTKAVQKAVARPAVIVDEQANRPAPIGAGFTTVTAWASLGIAMVLLLVFIVYSVISAAQPNEQATEPPTATAAPSPTPTVPAAIQSSRQNDGSQLTRYQAAYADPQQATHYTAPADLAAGGLTSLASGRSLQVSNVGWPPGSNVYLGLKDGGWEVWDTVSKTRISRHELANPDQYWQVSWSPDGENFAAITLDGQLKLGTEGRVLRSGVYAAPSGSYGNGYSWQSFYQDAFSWSPNSNYVLVNAPSSSMQLWSFGGGLQQVNRSENRAAAGFGLGNNGPNNFSMMAWSGDSRYLADLTSNGTQLNIYETRTLRPLATINVPQSKQTTYTNTKGGYGPVNLVWSPDGHYMALLRWIAEDTRNSYNSTTADLAVWEVPDIQVRPGVGNNRNNIITLTNVQTINLKNITSSYYPNSATLDWSGDDRLLLLANRSDPANPTNYNSQLDVYKKDETKTADPWGVQASLPLEPGNRPGLARWASDRTRILVNDDTGRLAFYNVLATGDKITSGQVLNQGQTGRLQGWTTSPDGKLAAVSNVGAGLSVKDVQTGQDLFKLDWPTSKKSGGLQQLKWSADGHYLAGLFEFYNSNNFGSSSNGDRGFEPIIRVWQIENSAPKLVGDYLLPNDTFYSAFDWNTKSKTPAIFFEIGLTQIGEWDLTRPPPSLDDQRKLKWVINDLNPDSFKPPAGANLPYRVVGNVGTDPKISRSGSNMTASVWLPDWQGVVIQPLGNSTAYSIYRVYTGTVVSAPKPVSLDPNPTQVVSGFNNQAIAPSPDGRLVAFGLTNGLVNVYETTNGKLVQSWTAHQGSVVNLVWSPDGKSLATSATDRSVKVWDTTSWRITATLRGSYDTPTMVEWLPDNKTLAVFSGYSPNTQLLWKFRS